MISCGFTFKNYPMPLMEDRVFHEPKPGLGQLAEKSMEDMDAHCGA